MAGERVLIVEDNARSLKLVRDLLRASGFETLEALTGEQAIALAQVHRPDLVLLDVQLPDLDGVAVLKRLRTRPATAAIRIVALTAYAMNEDRDRFLSMGFDGYLSKPIDILSFPDAVRRFCARVYQEG